MKIIFCILITCIFLVTGTSISIAATIAVDENGGADYTSIQYAVDNAKNGDTIVVCPGTYTENVIVNKSLTIISESGNPDDTIVRADDSKEHVFHVSANNVTIDGFSLMKAEGSHGIYLHEADGCIVTNNIVSNNHNGIFLWKSSNNILSNNIASSNDNYGIYLIISGNNILNNNAAWNNKYNFGVDGNTADIKHMQNEIDTSNTVDGKPIYYLVDVSDIAIDSSSNAGTVYCINCENISIKNLVLKNNGYGVSLHKTRDSYLENNALSNNGNGIQLLHSKRNMLSNNTANSSTNGIYFQRSEHNELSNNKLSNNYCGIYLSDFSNENTLTNNIANSNIQSGIFLDFHSNGNNVNNNTVSNSRCGILLRSSGSNELSNNTASNNRYGFYLRSSHRNMLSNNTAHSNYLHDVYIEISSHENILSNNTGNFNIVGISQNAPFLSPMLTAIALLTAFLVFRRREQK